MCRLFVGNFDFEWSLLRPPGAALPAALRRSLNERVFAWLAIAEPDDCLLCPGELPAEDYRRFAEQFPRPLPRLIRQMSEAPPDAELVPWAWTQRVIDDWRAVGRPLPEHPPPDVVRTVNSREFSTALEGLLGVALPQAAWVDSRGAVERRLRELTGECGPEARWLLKANFGAAGRERIVGAGMALTPPQSAWLDRQLSFTGGVAFEPWIDIRFEAGLLWNIPPAEPPTLVGIAPLLTDRRGAYRGSLLLRGDGLAPMWDEAIRVGRAAALWVQSTGYFGPLGIDAGWYRPPHGPLRCRPLQDLNARWTMGWLSLGWSELLETGEFGVWRHETAVRETARSASGRTFRVTPRRLDGLPVRTIQTVEIRRGTAAGNLVDLPSVVSPS